MAPEDLQAEGYARRLIADGYVRTSRRYRHLAKLPPGMTGKQALSLHDREAARRLDDDEAAGYYLRVFAPTVTIDETVFRAFQKLGGRVAR